MLEKKQIALAVAEISLKDLPLGEFKRYTYGKRIWEAFHYGRKYAELELKEQK